KRRNPDEVDCERDNQKCRKVLRKQRQADNNSERDPVAPAILPQSLHAMVQNSRPEREQKLIRIQGIGRGAGDEKKTTAKRNQCSASAGLAEQNPGRSRHVEKADEVENLCNQYVEPGVARAGQGDKSGDP